MATSCFSLSSRTRRVQVIVSLGSNRRRGKNLHPAPMRPTDTMTGGVVAALALSLVQLPLGRSSCDDEGPFLICRDIPSYYRAGHVTLVFYLHDVGEINSTVFRSDRLASVTRFRMDDAGVTAVAAGAFGTFLNLTSVSLRGNALTRLSWTWFGRPAALRQLSLTGNRVEALDRSAFRGLANLETLSLNRNRIRTVGPDTFRSQVNLTELDLSENRITRLSPQVFGSLGSTKIGLGRNPWDCACAAEDSISFLKDLHLGSRLLRPSEVTCDGPPSLRGRPAWDVSPCAPGSTSPSQTDQSKPTDGSDAPAADPAASSAATAAARPTSDTTLVLATVPEHTATRLTPPPSDTRTSGPPHSALTACVISVQPSDTSTVCALVVVIVVLCALLCAACFLALQRRRKRTRIKAASPGRPKEERRESEAGDRRSSADDRRPGRPEGGDPETARTRPFGGVRAKSANAVLFTAPFGACGNRVTVENETEDQSGLTEKQEVEIETGGTKNIPDENEKLPDDGKKLDGDALCVSVAADAVPYLSIGANQNQQSTDGVGQRSHVGQVLGRISTWPPTASQWKARCQMKGREEEERETGKAPSEDLENQDPPRMNVTRMEATHGRSSIHLKCRTTSLSEAPVADVKQEDAVAVRQTTGETPNPGADSAGRPAHEDMSDEADERNERRPAATSRRQGAGDRSAGSKAVAAAPSGGASPDDATLLRGNEYAFMDLLHEVVQHNGRWTRERWRQSHGNRQRR